jgi:hypothetical protein
LLPFKPGRPTSVPRGTLSSVSELPVTLEAAGVKSYAELYALPLGDVLQRLDEGAGRTLHPGDAFLAVVVLRAVAELGESTRRLDAARKGLERWGFALAVVATMATVAQVIQAFA